MTSTAYIAPPASSLQDTQASASLLEVHKLKKYFKVAKNSYLHAVDEISFQLAPGESLGLVGESGCGKSTLSRLIAKLLDIDEGEILFEGQSIGSLTAGRFPKHALRSQIQMVFQDAGDSLNPRFTAADAIAEPLKLLSSPKLNASAITERVNALAAEVGLPSELLSRFAHQLSGGQKARVGIARAIALSPKLLILDEPTAALDVSVQAVVLQLLHQLKLKHRMSFIFVSHDLNVVRLMCDRVAVMYLGKIIELGPADHIFDHPRHPYTRALQQAIPKVDWQAARAKPEPLKGEPTSPINPPASACRFADRCPQQQGLCLSKLPQLEAQTSLHSVACHFPLQSQTALSHLPHPTVLAPSLDSFLQPTS